MKVCTFTNLAAGAALLALIGFSACNASTIQTTAEEPATSAPPAETTPAAPAGDTAAPAGDTAAPAGDTAAPAGDTTAPATADDKSDRSNDAIAAVIQKNRAPFRECYDKARKNIPSLQGNMTLHFVLDGAGNVKSAELNIERSDIKSPKVVDCAIKVLKGLKFPPHPRGMDSTINYPFNFRPH